MFVHCYSCALLVEEYRLHLQLHSGEHARLAFAHLHLVQSPLQEHLINWLHALETSGIVIQIGAHVFSGGLLDQANSLGDGNTWCAR